MASLMAAEGHRALEGVVPGGLRAWGSGPGVCLGSALGRLLSGPGAAL